MRLNYNDGLKAANEVAKRLRKMDKPDAITEVYVGTYKNGRENGLKFGCATKDGWFDIVVSEYRSSDGIVVYLGNYDDRPCSYAGISDRMWENLVSFDYKDYQAAADAVVEHMENVTSGLHTTN